jgi:hypothetical protein
MKGVTPPFQPWAAELYTKRKDELAKDNPDARCLPIGALQMLAHPLPKKILHTPRLLVILHERNMEFRQIFLDGRPLPEDPQPSWYGYSTGRWEGDTLVVDTVGFRDGLWADFWGSPLTDRARMTERIRRPRFGALEIDVTIDDPKAYTKPWTVAVNQHLALDTELLEYACLENEKDVPRPGREVIQRGRRRSSSAGIGSCTRRRSGFTRSMNTAGGCCMSGPPSTTAVKLSLGSSPGGGSTFDSLIVQTLSMETSRGNRLLKKCNLLVARVRAIGKTPDDPRDLP